MEKILVIGLALTSLLGTGVVGTMMTGNNIGMMGMMQGYHLGIGSEGCSMMNDTNISNIHEECVDHMNEHCRNTTSGDCKEIHETRQDNMHDCCGQERTENTGVQHGCPMMH